MARNGSHRKVRGSAEGELLELGGFVDRLIDPASDGAPGMYLYDTSIPRGLAVLTDELRIPR